MIWLLLLKPRFHRAVAHDLAERISVAVLGPRCLVTGDHVYPKDRTAHENDQHYGEGPCA